MCNHEARRARRKQSSLTRRDSGEDSGISWGWAGQKFLIEFEQIDELIGFVI
jgi:hypothetical protein